MQNQTQQSATIYYLSATAIFSLLFILYLSTFPSKTSLSSDPFLFPTHSTNVSTTPPSIAYLISGSAGDSGRVIRVLQSVYHPLNQYLLHLDLTASSADREFLALTVQSVPIFKAARNVNVIGKADFNDPDGCSSVAATLHGASMLLRLSENWDWFIKLSAADYPLVTQDGKLIS